MEQVIKIGNLDLANLTDEKEKELFSLLQKRIEDRENSNSEFVIVRSHGAGVFFGTMKAGANGIVTLDKCRRLWYWKGAASLSQLAKDGTSDLTSKFSVRTSDHVVMGVIEIIPCTKVAAEKINSVKEWVS